VVVAVKYEFRFVYVRFAGTHEAYDRIDAEEFEMTIKPIKTKGTIIKHLRRLKSFGTLSQTLLRRIDWMC
jgi:hypothetical protein